MRASAYQLNKNPLGCTLSLEPYFHQQGFPVPVLFSIHKQVPQFREIGDLQGVAVAFGEYLWP